MQNDMRDMWQNQGGERTPISLEEIRRKAGKFHSTVRSRNLREYAGAVLGLAVFGFGAWHAPLPLMRAGDALAVAGLLYMMYQLHRKASAAPPELAGKTCRDFYRGQLERQRDALGSVWRWYLGPLVPGLSVILAAAGIANFRQSWAAGLFTVLFAIFVALSYVWLARLNHRAARNLQRQIDRLDGVEEESK